MVVATVQTAGQMDTWQRAGIFRVRFSMNLPALEQGLRRLAATGRAGTFAALTNRIVHQSFTDVWRTKWAAEFERRWYRRVNRRTGLSGQAWALARGVRSGTTWDYAISNAADYAEHVHPSGKSTPLFALEVPLWTAMYARDVEREIGARMRTAWAAALRSAVQDALARKQAAPLPVAMRLRAALAARGVR